MDQASISAVVGVCTIAPSGVVVCCRGLYGLIDATAVVRPVLFLSRKTREDFREAETTCRDMYSLAEPV